MTRCPGAVANCIRADTSRPRRPVGPCTPTACRVGHRGESTARAALQRFPFHTLKIDRSFVHGIGRDSNDSALVVAVIAMTQNLHLEVVGEGVENADQAAFLKEYGCNVAQGFHFGEAIAADSFERLLHTGPGPHPCGP